LFKTKRSENKRDCLYDRRDIVNYPSSSSPYFPCYLRSVTLVLNLNFIRDLPHRLNTYTNSPYITLFHVQRSSSFSFHVHFHNRSYCFSEFSLVTYQSLFILILSIIDVTLTLLLIYSFLNVLFKCRRLFYTYRVGWDYHIL